jgi:hypothetical protein
MVYQLEVRTSSACTGLWRGQVGHVGIVMLAIIRRFALPAFRQVAKPAGETKILKKGGETWRKPEKEGEILGRTWRFL